MQGDLLVITSIPPKILGRSKRTQDFGHATDNDAVLLGPGLCSADSLESQAQAAKQKPREMALHSHLIQGALRATDGPT